MPRLEYEQLPQKPGSFIIRETGQAYATMGVAKPVRAAASPKLNPAGSMENFIQFLVEEKTYGGVCSNQKKANFRVSAGTYALLNDLEGLDGPQALLTLADHCFSQHEAESLRLLVDGFVWCLAGLPSSARIGDSRRVASLNRVGAALLEVSFPFRRFPLVAQLRGELQDRLEEMETDFKIAVATPEDGDNTAAH